MPDIYVTVKIAGEDATGLVQHVEVEESDVRADLATLTFVDQSLVLPDVLHEGLGIEIDLGRQDVHALVFRGVVTSLRCGFPHQSAARVVVEAVDTLVGLSLKPQTKRWWNTTLSTVVREIAVASSMVPGRIEPAEDPTFDEDRPLQQVEETDLALLYRLARDNDCKVFVEHSGPVDRLGFVATSRLLSDQPIDHELVFNQNVVDLETTFEAFEADPEQKLVSTDLQTGERIETDQKSVTGGDTSWTPDPARIARLGTGAAWVTAVLAKGTPVRTQLTDHWRTRERVTGAASRSSSDHAAALGDRARRLGQAARGRTTGDVDLQPRKMVKLTGFGGRWSGSWYLTAVRHEIDIPSRSYTTSFTARR
jgi:phage protein D